MSTIFKKIGVVKRERERERVNKKFHNLKFFVVTVFSLSFLFVANLPAKAITPDQISGLKLWLDASTGVTKDGVTAAANGDLVKQWNDRSVGSYNATQVATTSRPTYIANSIGNIPALRFSGSQNITTSSFLNTSFDKSFTFFIVKNTTSTSSVQVTTSNGGTVWYSGGQNNSMYNTGLLSSTQILQSLSLPMASSSVEAFRYDGAKKDLYINSNKDNTSASALATGNLGLAGALTIGSLSTNSFYFTGDIAEIIIYNSVLNDTQVEQIKSYLLTKYGVPVVLSSPVASLPTGIYTSSQSISLSAVGSDYIRYSTSSVPVDCSSGILYSSSSPILASSSLTIYARACDSLGASTTGTFAYTILPSTIPLFVFDGDSITYGNGSTGGQTYPYQVQTQLGLTASYQNFGRPSYTVLNMSSDASTRIDPEYFSSRATNILTLMGGTNDLYFGANATTTYNRIVSYLQARRTAGFKVITNTILPRSNAGTPVTFETDRQIINSLLRANWRTFADGLSDIASDSIIGPVGAELNTTYYPDAVHMTNAGYGIAAQYVTAAIKQIMNPIGANNISINPSATAAAITWATNQTGSTKINYGLSSSYGASTTETDTVTRLLSHSTSLSGLIACTTYHLQTVSNDLNGNQATSTDQTFTTSGCAASATVVSTGSSQIATSTGGTLTLSNFSLTVPAAFGSADANFQAHQLNTADVLPTISSPSGYTSAGSYLYDLKALPSISTTTSSFDQSLTVTMSYSASDIAGLNESTLKISRWDGASWNELSSCSVNTSAKTVTCTTTHFSVFGLFGQTLAQTSSSVAASGMPLEWYNAPQAPAGGFGISINNDAKSVSSPMVALSLKGGSDTVKMAISNSIDFQYAAQDNYMAATTWNLCWSNASSKTPSSCPAGTYTVYAKFYAPWGKSSEIVSDSIIYEPNAAISPAPATLIFFKALALRLSGRILLQVESHGEAWYVNPINHLRYYLGRPDDAFNIMRSLGLGVSNADLANFKVSAPARLSGRILLQVQDKGQAYYVNPVNLKLYYLGRPDDAYALMRSKGLGITNNDLMKMETGTLNK